QTTPTRAAGRPAHAIAVTEALHTGGRLMRPRGWAAHNRWSTYRDARLARQRPAWRSQRRGLARAGAAPPARPARVTAPIPSGRPPLTWPATSATGTPAAAAAASTVPVVFPVSEVGSNLPSPVMTRSAAARARSRPARGDGPAARGARPAPQAAASR